ncbi:M81 family metallopeptidase [Pseudogracilibacillus sp. SE30717A]|uniref:M81 family metallopeptidase n=1 Tax=Pseudogracilibacillus sp. SE30717A TaxID=3098293 RepID=UPI00300E2642
MKIVVGNWYQESTTFNPIVMDERSFVFFEGEASKYRVAATDVLEKRGIEVIPTIYATAISGGCVTEEAYRFFADKILNVLKTEKNIDGIWLHLHGAMEVVNIGSGEAQLLREIREIVGNDIPISLTLDLHGNIDVDVPKLANIIRGYRTAPHTDQEDTERITANMLADCIEKNVRINPVFKRIPMITPGEKATGKTEPMKTILSRLTEYEKMEGILLANYFNGHAWTDAPNTSASAIIIPESENYQELAEEVAEELAEFVYGLRNKFTFPMLTLKPAEAIDRALGEDDKPVFISDSGDNTTGGAAGLDTVLLRHLVKKNIGNKKVLVAAIYDEASYNKLSSYEIGNEVSIEVGANFDENSAPVKLTGTLKAKGELLGYQTSKNDVIGNVCTIDVGNIDIVVANHGDSFTTINHFKKAGLEIQEYDVIIVKQGYLFDELSEIAALEILALTPGATYQLVEELEFHHLIRPMYPLDK